MEGVVGTLAPRVFSAPFRADLGGAAAGTGVPMEAVGSMPVLENARLIAFDHVGCHGAGWVANQFPGRALKKHDQQHLQEHTSGYGSTLPMKMS